MKCSLTPWRYFLLILVLTLENHFNILQLSKRQSKNNIEDKKIFVEIEDVETPVDLADASAEFQGKEITLTIAQNTELA